MNQARVKIGLYPIRTLVLNENSDMSEGSNVTGYMALGQMLASSNTTLTSLIAYGNKFGERTSDGGAIQVLATALKKNTTLTSLTIVSLVAEHLELIAPALATNRVLQTIRLESPNKYNPNEVFVATLLL